MDSRLSGTWISDREATVARLQSEAIYPEEVIVKISELTGKMTVRYEPGFYTLDNCELKGRYPFKIIESSTDKIKVLDLNDSTIRTLIFDSTGYWVDSGDPRLKDFHEHFIRKQ